MAQDQASLHRAFASSLRDRYGVDPDDFYQKIMGLEVRAAEDVGAGDVAPRILNQTAYHGSPHVFDSFSTEKIGTGEGAQAFGWGLYFAGRREIADYYRQTLTRGGLIPDNVKAALDDLDSLGFDTRGEALENIRAAPNEWRERWDVRPERSETERRAAEIIDEFINTPRGRTFEVRLAPREDEYLLYDRPFEEQSDVVKQAVNRLRGQKKRSVLRRVLDFGAATDPGKEFNLSSGRSIYDSIASDLDGRQAASLALLDHGVRGIKYLAGDSRRRGDGNFNYVIFDDADISVESFWQQGLSGVPRGRIALTPGKTVISLFNTADNSTFLHESGHFFLASLERLDALGSASARKDLNIVRKWLGSDGIATDAAQEKFARGFEAWLREGKAPTAALANAFRHFAEWLVQIYRHVRALDVEINDDIRALFARMLGGKKSDQPSLDAKVHHSRRPGSGPDTRSPFGPGGETAKLARVTAAIERNFRTPRADLRAVEAAEALAGDEAGRMAAALDDLAGRALPPETVVSFRIDDEGRHVPVTVREVLDEQADVDRAHEAFRQCLGLPGGDT